MGGKNIHMYVLYGFVFLSVIIIRFFTNVYWLLPLVLTVWALFGLFRLFGFDSALSGRRTTDAAE